ncbi:type II secretion system protein GspM [Desulfuromonas sp. KJ2020]|uniref:type II secretion system protein GspM n=1 Tax=Desulfuromonas sp. KJ2020 TaxID=2919173 RepID=UPI0020A81FA3|nr:type II secretion system protein GspM [Desulfuromonas sp. KJ2020]MCP3177191.1 type II secretion system protein GspM [Desulfuromonas sp. KJ2020]
MIANLTPRERLILTVGGLFVLLALAYLLVWSPYRNAMERFDSQITSRQRQMGEIQQLRQEFLRLNQRIAQAEAQLARARSFSLFSFVEEAGARIASRENLVSMRPQPASEQNGFREEAVEIKLEKIRLDQLVQLLYEIETAEAFLRVKNLRVKTRFDNRSQLDATLVIASLGKSQ